MRGVPVLTSNQLMAFRRVFTLTPVGLPRLAAAVGLTDADDGAISEGMDRLELAAAVLAGPAVPEAGFDAAVREAEVFGE